MTKRERITVGVALAILRDEAGIKPERERRPEWMRLALYVLAPYVPRDTLRSYWSVADNPNSSQRSHNLRRVLAVIEASIVRATTK